MRPQLAHHIDLKLPQPVILASASPRRIQLLKEWGVKYTVCPSHIKETTSAKKPSSIVKELALKKAESVARNVHKGIVIGADTIVVLKGDIIGKPRDSQDAQRILSRLNGSYHRVYTGVAVIDAATGKTRVGYDVSRVKMRRLSIEEIRLFSSRHLDKAGAYAVQETDDAFVEKIEGDYFNVVGLPFNKLRELLLPFSK
jgi:septum formation protein